MNNQKSLCSGDWQGELGGKLTRCEAQKIVAQSVM